jgi:hypothetical protein
MTIKSLQSTSLTNNIFYRSMLAGNDAFFPEFESDDFLEEVVLTSSASSVTFSGLGTYSDYKHLQIRMVLKSAYSANDLMLDTKVQLNGDTGSNYAYHALQTDNTGVVNSQSSTNSPNMVIKSGSTNSKTANDFAAYLVDILDFSNPSKNTTQRVFGGGITTTGAKGLALSSGLWNNTAAVTQVSILAAGTAAEYAFVAGSRISLYGSKA